MMSTGGTGGDGKMNAAAIRSGASRLFAVILITVIGWFLLTLVAAWVRANDPSQVFSGPILEDVETSRTWMIWLLGLAGSLAGFLGIGAAAARDDLAARSRLLAAGSTGMLAGATFLDVGGWPIPAALGIYLAGGIIPRVISALRNPPKFEEV